MKYRIMQEKNLDGDSRYWTQRKGWFGWHDYPTDWVGNRRDHQTQEGALSFLYRWLDVQKPAEVMK